MRAQVFLLTGEAGSGKSQFVASLAHDLAMSYSSQKGKGGRRGATGESEEESGAVTGGGGSKGKFLPVMFDAREAEGEDGIPLDGLVQHYLTTQLG